MQPKIIFGIIILCVLIISFLGCVQQKDNETKKNTSSEVFDVFQFGGNNPTSYKSNLPENVTMVNVEYSFNESSTMAVYTLNFVPSVSELTSMIKQNQFSGQIDSKTIESGTNGSFQLNARGAKSIVIVAPGAVGTVKITSIT